MLAENDQGNTLTIRCMCDKGKNLPFANEQDAFEKGYRKVKKLPAGEFVTKCPGMPPAVEGLMLSYEETGTPSPAGLSFCRITEDEFLDVYHDYKQKKVHPAALKKTKPIESLFKKETTNEQPDRDNQTATPNRTEDNREPGGTDPGT